MNCPECGKTLGEDEDSCGDCGASIRRIEPSAATGGAAIQRLMQTAWKALKAIIVNPVEDVPRVLAELQKQEALQTGFVLAGLFDLCAVIGLYLALPRWAGSPGFGDVLKLLLLGLAPPAAVCGAGTLLRKVFQGKGGTIESDVFLAGAALIPTGLVLLLTGLLGIANLEVVAVIAVFALTYTILILYTGCTQIAQIATSYAIPAVPVILLIAGWITKIFFAALF